MKHLLNFNDEFFDLQEMSFNQQLAFYIATPDELDGINCIARYGGSRPQVPTTLATTHLMDCFENIFPNVINDDELQEMLRRIGQAGIGYIKFKNLDLQVGFIHSDLARETSWDGYFANLYKPRKNKPSKRERMNLIIGDKNA